MKLKNLVKKGGVADIVTLMIIVGLVIALIIAVVLPMIDDARNSGGDNDAMIGFTDGYIEGMAGTYGSYGEGGDDAGEEAGD